MEIIKFIVDGKFDRDHICSICNDLMKDPVLINGDKSCGHLFCRSCITKWFNTKKECPTCHNYACTDMLITNSNSYRMKCIYTSNGCIWQGNYGEDGEYLSTHINECKHRSLGILCNENRDDLCDKKILPCKYSTNGCLVQMTHDLLDSHHLICSYRPMICQFICYGLPECKEIKYWCDWARHQLECAQLHLHAIHSTSVKEAEKNNIKINKLKRRIEELNPPKLPSKLVVATGSSNSHLHKNKLLTIRSDKYGEGEVSISLRTGINIDNYRIYVVGDGNKKEVFKDRDYLKYRWSISDKISTTDDQIEFIFEKNSSNKKLSNSQTSV